MRMKINRAITTKEEVDVDFPIYRDHCLDGDYSSTTIYTKVYEGEDGKLIKQDITISDRGIEIEISRNYRFDNSDADYLLGKGLYQSSAVEFREAALQAKAILDEILSSVEQ